MTVARIRVLGGVVATGIVAVLALVPPAHAHKTWAFHGLDYASLGEGHLLVRACDKEHSDGNRVRAQYYTVLNPTMHSGPWDGADHGCAADRYQSGLAITSYRICEETEGCSSWKNDV